MKAPAESGYATKMRMRTRPDFHQILRWAGTGAWLGVSITTIVRALSIERLLIWSLASVSFIALFAYAQRRSRHSRSLTALQSVSVIAMVAALCNGYEGFLLVVVAAQLGWRENYRVGLTWIALQTAAMGAAIAYEWTVRSALLLAPPYIGFQLLMYALTRFLAEERSIRAQLEDSNHRLLELQQQLAKRSRLDERLRLTQELHDVFGHRLTALSLQLEAVAYQVAGATRQAIESSQSLARTLLDDVKELVDVYKEDAPVDLIRELQDLARELPRPKVHLDCPPALTLDDPRMGRALLRCVQEFITNSIRHGSAHNVWIRIATDAGRLCLVARDDGRGAIPIRTGFGLSGMRRRMEELGGLLALDGHSTEGFSVRAELPLTLEERA